MASTSNGTGNLVDEFEESFQECVHALTKQEASTGVEKDEIGMEVDLTTMKFIDLARQMEAFFIQKRYLLSVLKPQLVLKEENVDLRWEINRKEEMIKKHYDSIDRWKNMLSDAQPQHTPHPSPQQPQMPPQMAPIPQGGMPHAGIMGAGPIGMPHPGPGPGPGPMPPMAMQQQQQQQQQQQHIMQAQQMHMQQMQVGGGPQMFMQQGGVPMNPVRANVSGSGMPMANFGQGPNVLPGPLAFLEKTTSNIGKKSKKQPK